MILATVHPQVHSVYLAQRNSIFEEYVTNMIKKDHFVRAGKAANHLFAAFMMQILY